MVTGASRGIGRGIAEALAQAGADVCCVARGADGAVSAAAACRDRGRQAHAVAADVSAPADVERVFAECDAKLGPPAIVVNNAGITADNLLLRMKPEDWDQVMAVNLRGTFLCTKAALRPMMKARTGRVINVSSVVGLSGNPGQANYAASKAGIIAFSKTVAREVASRGITVNVVCPGFITTDMTAAMTDEARQQVTASIPLGRLGTPADIAEAAVFLAGDEAGYITGAVLVVDGGLSL